ncbi:hypothetical protein Tco_0370498 [Tanacetum coccineum]
MESLNSNFQERELHQLQQMQDNAKESCIVSFQFLHSYLKALSNNDFKGTSIGGGFERAFTALFDQDVQTFTCSMLLNLDQLEKQLDKEKFQEIGSMDAFRTSVQTKDHADSLIVQLNCKSVENADLKAQIQEKVFANAALKNKLRKIKGTSMDTKLAKSSTLGKPVLQPHRNQSVVRQPTAFKSE